MPTDPLDRLSRILKALTHPTALRIVLLLHQQGPLYVHQIYTQLAIDQATTSARLSKLADLGVVVRYGGHLSRRYGLADPSAIAIETILLLGQRSGPIPPKRRSKRRFAG